MYKLRRFITLLLILCLLPALSFAAPEEIVTNTNDSGPGSLRQAVMDVDPIGVVRIDPSLAGDPIILTSGSIVVNKSITIVGLQTDTAIIDGTALGADPVFNITSSLFMREVTVEGSIGAFTMVVEDNATLILNDARVMSGMIGIEVQAGGTLRTNRSIFEQSTVVGILVRGGASGTDEGGSAEVDHCAFTNMPDGIGAAGGGADNAQGGVATVTNTLFLNLTITGASALGGASDSALGGQVTVTESLFSFNEFGTFAAAGAADNAFGGVVELINVTITSSGTTGARSAGGGLGNEGGGTTIISFSTIVRNTNIGIRVDPGMNGNPGDLDIKNSIVAENTGDDCVSGIGLLTAVGQNFDTDGTCAGFDTDFTTTTAMMLNLDIIGSAGGATSSIVPQPPSVAIDAAPTCTDIFIEPVTQDQRTFPRPFGPACDVGAVEYQPTGIFSISKTSVPPGETGFLFGGTGFTSGCVLDDSFIMDDGDLFSCIVPTGIYTIEEFFLAPGGVNISCTEPPVNKTFNSVTMDIAEGDNEVCTFANDTRPLELSPIFPAVQGNPNFMSAFDVLDGSFVAFIWGFELGEFTVPGNVCGGVKLGITPFQLLGFAQAGANQIADFVFFIVQGSYNNPTYTQAVDLFSCRVSDVVPNIISNK